MHLLAGEPARCCRRVAPRLLECPALPCPSGPAPASAGCLTPRSAAAAALSIHDLAVGGAEALPVHNEAHEDSAVPDVAPDFKAKLANAVRRPAAQGAAQPSPGPSPAQPRAQPGPAGCSGSPCRAAPAAHKLPLPRQLLLALCCSGPVRADAAAARPQVTTHVWRRKFTARRMPDYYLHALEMVMGAYETALLAAKLE
jgi:hypothetical protein